MWLLQWDRWSNSSVNCSTALQLKCAEFVEYPKHACGYILQTIQACNRNAYNPLCVFCLVLALWNMVNSRRNSESAAWWATQPTLCWLGLSGPPVLHNDCLVLGSAAARLEQWINSVRAGKVELYITVFSKDFTCCFCFAVYVVSFVIVM